MKLLRNISLPLIASLALFACERDYDAPLLTEPEYTGPAANITISELRTEMRQQLKMRLSLSRKTKCLKPLSLVTMNQETSSRKSICKMKRVPLKWK